jgi:hypothetical protein
MGARKPSRNRVVELARQATPQPGGIGSLESILELLKSLKIRAQYAVLHKGINDVLNLPDAQWQIQPQNCESDKSPNTIFFYTNLWVGQSERGLPMRTLFSL